jgi:hypothetical protein
VTYTPAAKADLDAKYDVIEATQRLVAAGWRARVEMANSHSSVAPSMLVRKPG